MRSIPDLKDKIICAALYTGLFIQALTWVPIIWIIVANVRKSYMKDFIKYHCYQAILFNMIAFALPHITKLLVDFIANILSITVIFENSISPLVGLTEWIIGVYFILIKVVAVYAIIWTFRGRFTYMPPISQAVNMLLR